jgi:non-ribosomal peptide synthase protein (TIGR01720 family)
LAALLVHHDALRLRYHQENGEWRQSYTALDNAVPFHVETLSGPNLATSLDERATYWQASLNLEDGPLTRMVLFHHTQGHRLLWVIHHLAVDGVSWRILLEDLHTVYTQARAGEILELPAKTSSFKAWSEHLLQWRNSSGFATQAEYWRQLPRPASELPVDNPAGSNRVADTCHYTLTLDETITRALLEQTPAAYRTGINDLLISALLLALHDWSGQSQYIINLESHGRSDLFDDIDLSRTVGWFTALYSVVLELPESDDLGILIKNVKEQLRQVPHDGIGYGLLRQQGEELVQGQIVFNYLGQFGQTVQQDEGFRFAQERSGRYHSLTGTREHLIDINGLIVNGQLGLTFSYSSEQYREDTIQTLAERYKYYLEHLIEHCQNHYGYTPSDFPLVKLSQSQLDTLVQPYGNNIAAIYPLSPMQQGMLFHSLYAPDNDLYFEQFSARLSGIQPVILRQAWQWLVDRHPILRTAFSYNQEPALQIVLKQAKLPWTETDWINLGEEERQQQWETLLEQERHSGFDFSHAPLMRLHLIRETADSYRLLWHNHHILMDGWSLPILFTELFTVYTALRQGKNPALPLVNRYQNYIAWLVQQDRQAAQSYWQQKLAGFSAPTPIPIAKHGQQTAVH